MADRVRSFDWSRTPLGPLDRWPQSLRTAVDILLSQLIPMIILWGSDLIQIYNDAYAVIAASKHPAALGQPNRECWPEALPITEPIYQRVLKHGERVLLEDECIPLGRHGRGRLEDAYFTVSYSPCRNDDGRIAGIFVTVIEVTHRVLAEQERARLRENEEQLRAMFEQAAVGIARIGLDGRWLRVNGRYCEIVGYERDELLTKTFQDITHPDDLDADVLQLRQLIEGEIGRYSMEKRYVRRDGSLVWVNLTVSAVRGPGGEVVYFIAVAEDITARRASEEARRRVEYRFQRLVEHSPQSTQLFYPDGRTRQVNRAFERLFGITIDQLRDYNILHDPELVRLGVMPLMQRAFAGEAATIEPIPYVTDRGEYAGQTRWAGAYVYPVKNENGQIEEVVLVHNDVTDQRQAEEEVRRSQRQLNSIIDNAPSAIFLKDLDGRYLLVNAPFERMAQVPVGSMAGKTDADLFPPDIAAQFRAEDERVAQLREPMTFEESFEFKGEHLTFVTNKFPLRRETGEVYAVCGIATDVTALKRAEAAVRESEQRLRLGLRAGRTGTWDWDILNNRVIWSEQVYEIHGLQPDEFGGTSEDFVRLIHPDDAERVWSLVQASLNEGKPYEVEFRTLRPAGEVRWVFTTGQVIRDNGGRPMRMMGAMIDSTERKNAEADRDRLLEAERVARTEAERASRMKDEFLATLSHELRTPLNAILGWSQVLARGGELSEDLADGLRTIERNARAQAQIIEDLLDMSRIISGKVRLDVQRVDLAALLREAVETATPSADAKGIRLTAVLDPLAGPVSGDPNRLQQVFWNLLTNAVKFTPKGGRVQVMLERVNSHVEASVIDTGEGIRPEFLPHVFDRFRQADASTTRRHGGLGLGLSIVKQLVELHGGSIRAKSAGEGQGATFTVSLPLAVIHPEPQPELERRHPKAGGQTPLLLPDRCASLAGVRVLVVDDEPDARALVRRLLEDCNAVVFTAASVAEALELIRTERPDVLVSDIGMPTTDGYEFIRQVRALGEERGGKTPALALTAYARSEDRMRAVRAGFQMHVPKPVEPAELITMVASLAGRS